MIPNDLQAATMVGIKITETQSLSHVWAQPLRDVVPDLPQMHHLHLFSVAVRSDLSLGDLKRKMFAGAHGRDTQEHDTCIC